MRLLAVDQVFIEANARGRRVWVRSLALDGLRKPAAPLAFGVTATFGEAMRAGEAAVSQTACARSKESSAGQGKPWRLARCVSTLDADRLVEVCGEHRREVTRSVVQWRLGVRT